MTIVFLSDHKRILLNDSRFQFILTFTIIHLILTIKFSHFRHHAFIHSYSHSVSPLLHGLDVYFILMFWLHKNPLVLLRAAKHAMFRQERSSYVPLTTLRSVKNARAPFHAFANALRAVRHAIYR